MMVYQSAVLGRNQRKCHRLELWMNGKEVLSGHTFASRAEKEQKEEDNWFHCKEGPMIDIENEENKELYKSQVILDFI